MCTFIWNDVSLPNLKALCESFPRLFSLSINKEMKVGEVWNGNPEGGEWRLEWRRSLFVWEMDLVHSLKIGLLGVEVGDGVDWWKWKPEEGGVFFGKFLLFLIGKLVFVRWGS